MRKTTLAIPLLLLLLATPWALAEGVFDHRLHTEDADLECAACHVDGDSGSPVEGLMPKLGACLDCHDEEIRYALPEHPASHIGDFRYEHQFDARDDGADCVLCHQESESCTLCHHGENVDFLIHDRDFLYSHPLEAMQGVEDCASCHETRSFCVDCHMQEGIKPGDHIPGQWGLAGYHDVAAREDLASCLTCHDGPEPVCINCHH
jgi:hypothetical protein